MSIALNLAYSENKLYKTFDYWSKDMFNFDFLEKGLGIVSPANFVYDFSRKIFLMLRSINWPNLIVSLLLLPEILDKCASQLFFSQVVTSWILKSSLSFQSSHFSTWTKSKDKNLNILRAKKDFKDTLNAYH